MAITLLFMTIVVMAIGKQFWYIYMIHIYDDTSQL